MAPVHLLINIPFGSAPTELKSMQVEVVLLQLPVSAYLAMKKLQYMASLEFTKGTDIAIVYINYTTT